MRRTRSGFSLIELVVVVSILVLLAGVLVPLVRNEMDKAMGGRATSDMKVIADAFNRYYAHTGYWPTESKNDALAASKQVTLSKMACLFENVHQRKSWSGPYLNAGVPVAGVMNMAQNGANGWNGAVDPWGTPFRLYYFGKGAEMGPYGGIALLSYGKNRKNDSSTAEVAAGTPAGDDTVMIVSRSL
jgi:prepilin-type N-terminal cleavage/methylation domain-containing protein